ncbi:MAG TPA: hypothetical protein VFQ72_00080 [Candidatus Paceibacterota bacterium]|nr:hypothetical protein [Candidatus Paceibacterota bacterium]
MLDRQQIIRFPENPEDKLYEKRNGIFWEVDIQDIYEKDLLKEFERHVPTFNPHRKLDENKLRAISLTMGLSKAESKIIAATWSRGFSMASIHRATGIPKGSLTYALDRLCERRLLTRLSPKPADDEKRPRWKSRLPDAIRELWTAMVY